MHQQNMRMLEHSFASAQAMFPGQVCIVDNSEERALSVDVPVRPAFAHVVYIIHFVHGHEAPNNCVQAFIDAAAILIQTVTHL